MRDLYDSIDWAATGAWMQAWVGLVGAGAVIWAANKGSEAFTQWLRQKQTERQIDTAERALTIVYRANDAFRTIRSPGSMGGEVSAAEEKLKTSNPSFDSFPEGKKRRLVTAQTAMTRLADQADLWKDLWAAVPLVRAYLGADFAEKFRSIWLQRAKIYAAASAYGGLDAYFEDIEPTKARDMTSKWEAVFWEGWAEAAGHEDEVGDALKKLTEEAEALINPLLTSEVHGEKKAN